MTIFSAVLKNDFISFYKKIAQDIQSFLPAHRFCHSVEARILAVSILVFSGC